MKAVFILKIYWRSHLLLLSLLSKSVKLHSGLKAVIFPHHEFSCLTILHLCPLCLVLVLKLLSCVWLFVTPGLQHARLPCPSLSPSVCSNSCPLNQWCHPTISSSVIPFSSCLQFFLASGSFPNSLLSASGGQSTGASASATVFPKNIQGWFPLGLTWFDLFAAQGTFKSLLHHHNSKASVLQHSASFMVQLSHSYMTTGKTIALTRRSFVSQVLAGGLVVRILHSHGHSPHGVLFPVREAFRLPLCLPLFLILH